jgi:hypothetical protein
VSSCTVRTAAAVVEDALGCWGDVTRGSLVSAAATVLSWQAHLTAGLAALSNGARGLCVHQHPDMFEQV